VVEGVRPVNDPFQQPGINNMNTGIFVVGALREMELCSKSWKIPYAADYHLLTWTRTTDRFVEGSRDADLNAVYRADVGFKSVHAFDKASEFVSKEVVNDFTYWALQGPWFWKKTLEMFPEYDAYVVLRPDLFLWPQEGGGWPTLPEGFMPMYTLGKRQDQMFITDYSGLSWLAGTYEWILRNPDRHHDIHSYLEEYFSPMGLDMNVDHETLRSRFHYSLARPNSRYLANCDFNKSVAQGVFRLTAEWWTEYTGGEYEGLKELT
jgi:hypothetical protein